MIDLDDSAIARALNMEHDLDVDLLDPQTSILIAQLATAREGAIDALRALADVNPHEWQVIQKLQNDVNRFRGLATWLVNQRYRAAEAWAQLNEEEREQVRAYTKQPRSYEINDA